MIMTDLIEALHIVFPAHIGEAAWIITGYLLGYTVAMPLFGGLADVEGSPFDGHGSSVALLGRQRVVRLLAQA